MDLPSAEEWQGMTPREQAAFVSGATAAKNLGALKKVPKIISSVPTKTRSKEPPPRRTARMPPQPWPAIERRNLLFYLFPLTNPSRVWQWHVAQLRRRLSVFNGRRIVCIGTGGKETDDGLSNDQSLPLSTPREVRKQFGCDARKIEFITLPNDASAWEAMALRTMLGMVESRSPHEASFYFHGKGVRRIHQVAVRPWSETIYRHTLTPDAVDSLRFGKACGIALRNADPTGARNGRGGWHFSGNGWWARHDALFVRGWINTLQETTHGAEAYLSTRFDRHEVRELLAVHGDVYDPATWRPWDATVRVSVIVTARNYGRFLKDCLESCFYQDLSPHEVIYCDDSSQDDSLAIARRFHGLKIIPLKKNLDVCAARNHAAARATGNALLFVDGDNILPRNFLSACVPQLRYDVSFVYTDLCVFGNEAVYHRQPDWQQFDEWQRNHCDTCSLIQRRAFDAAGGWMDDHCNSRWCAMEDYHLFLRLTFFGAARRANVALGYRRHGDSLTAASGRDGTLPSLQAAQEQIREDVRRWAMKKFGRMPNRQERDEGVIFGTPINYVAP